MPHVTPHRRPVVAIDGPTAAGKSTVARAVARRLGFVYVDTGAMYRSVALAALRRNIALDDAPTLERLALALDMQCTLEEDGERIVLDGEDITTAIRSPEVSTASSVVSTLPGVRTALVARQRALAVTGGVVMEGRDIGTVVLPDADVKVFLDASLDARAARRYAELSQRGSDLSFDEVRRAEAERDRRDRDRQHSPLRPAPDAVVIDTTERSADDVSEFVVRLARQRMETT
jgi:cytidylate kinase